MSVDDAGRFPFSTANTGHSLSCFFIRREMGRKCPGPQTLLSLPPSSEVQSADRIVWLFTHYITLMLNSHCLLLFWKPVRCHLEVCLVSVFSRYELFFWTLCSFRSCIPPEIRLYTLIEVVSIIIKLWPSLLKCLFLAYSTVTFLLLVSQCLPSCLKKG